MDSFMQLLSGLGNALTPENLAYAFIGCLVGTLVGVLPGIGPALTIALLMPLTYGLGPGAAFIMFAGIFYGAMYGGSTTSILMKTPGESGSIIASIDGHKMAKAGRGAAALATAAIGSFVAGLIATLLLAFFAPVIADYAIKLGSADYLALMVLAFLTVSSLMGRSVIRGLAALGIGLVLGVVGMDFQSGQARLTFGNARLLDGIDVVLLIVALFAIGEVLYVVAHRTTFVTGAMSIKGQKWMTRSDWRRSWKPWLRGTAIGFPMGTIPAGGSEIPTFLSYSLERKLSKHPEEFGKGAIEGVAGPEAANNANAAGVLVPLLTLGLPTSGTAAVILVAFQQFGLQPGPQLMTTQADLVWTLIASLLIGNAILLVLNLPLVGMWVKLLSIPKQYLYAGISVFALLGAYALSSAAFEIFLMLGIGVLGYFLRRFGVPITPVIIGAILGPLSELQLRRTLDISAGDPKALVNSPFAATVYSILVIMLIAVVALRMRARKRDHGEVSELVTEVTTGASHSPGFERQFEHTEPVTTVSTSAEQSGRSADGAGDESEPDRPRT